MCRCPGIPFISWIRSLRSGCLQPAGVRPWSSLLPVAGASVPLRFFFSADCSSIVCDRSSCFSFLPSEVSLSLKLLISADRLSFVCSVQIVAPPCRPRPFGCGTSLSGGSYSFLVAYCPCVKDRWLTAARCGRDCPAASFASFAACPVDV